MILLFFLFLNLISNITPIKVQLSTGTIEGKEVTATYSPLGHQKGYAFMGIPYAKPPLGDLRFQKPQPPDSWEGVLQTKEHKPSPVEIPEETNDEHVVGPASEDRLYLSVFTNEFCMQTKNCSVFVMVHGGQLISVSAAFDPEIMINNFLGNNRNVIVVAVNYRIGIAGFGHLIGEDKHSMWGALDIIETLKWTRREIYEFGGNKDRITLGGHSAGSMFSAVVSLSPLSKGLIKQQILMSGPLHYLSKMSNSKATTVIAQQVGCISEDVGFRNLSEKEVKQVYDCLRQVSNKKILDAQNFILKNTTYVMGFSHVDESVLLDYPDRMYDEKSVFPITTLVGTVTAEERYSEFLLEPRLASQRDDLLKYICEQIGYQLFEEPEDFSEKCQNHYSTGDEVRYLADDMMFHAPMIKIANAHVSNHTKIYMYSYDYKGAGAAFNHDLPPPPHHAEDLIYFEGLNRGPWAPKDYIIEYIYSEIFVNFINYGEPYPSGKHTWLPYTPENREYFLVDFDQNFTMPGQRRGYYEKANEFWNKNIGPRSYREYFSPSADSFSIGNFLTIMKSHVLKEPMDRNKSLEISERQYYEQKEFLKKLKLERKMGVKTGMRNGRVPMNTGYSFSWIVFAGTLLTGFVYFTVSRGLLRRNSGYQRL